MTSDDNQPLTEDGVDLTLIRWMRWLTPAERLQFVQEQNSQLPPQTEAQKLAILRRTLEESKKPPFWPHTPQQ